MSPEDALSNSNTSHYGAQQRFRSVIYVTDCKPDPRQFSLKTATQEEDFCMLQRRQLRRLPPDVQLEVEALLSELRGERGLPSDIGGSTRCEPDTYVPTLLRLRRFVAGPQTDESR